MGVKKRSVEGWILDGGRWTILVDVPLDARCSLVAEQIWLAWPTNCRE